MSDLAFGALFAAYWIPLSVLAFLRWQHYSRVSDAKAEAGDYAAGLMPLIRAHRWHWFFKGTLYAGVVGHALDAILRHL